jgi:hypothetical protein
LLSETSGIIYHMCLCSSVSKWRPFVEMENVSNNFVKILNEFDLYSMDFALCRALDFLASLISAFFCRALWKS